MFSSGKLTLETPDHSKTVHPHFTSSEDLAQPAGSAEGINLADVSLQLQPPEVSEPHIHFSLNTVDNSARDESLSQIRVGTPAPRRGKKIEPGNACTDELQHLVEEEIILENTVEEHHLIPNHHIHFSADTSEVHPHPSAELQKKYTTPSARVAYKERHAHDADNDDDDAAAAAPSHVSPEKGHHVSFDPSTGPIHSPPVESLRQTRVGTPNPRHAKYPDLDADEDDEASSPHDPNSVHSHVAFKSSLPDGHTALRQARVATPTARDRPQGLEDEDEDEDDEEMEVEDGEQNTSFIDEDNDEFMDPERLALEISSASIPSSGPFASTTHHVAFSADTVEPHDALRQTRQGTPGGKYAPRIGADDYNDEEEEEGEERGVGACGSPSGISSADRLHFNSGDGNAPLSPAAEK